MTVDLVIRGGKILTTLGFIEGSLAIEAGKIVSISTAASAPPADRVVEANDNLVLPGMVDMHVHFRDPGFTEREDFETGTTAAAAGGVTTVADMPNTVPSVTSVEALMEKIRIADRKALVDFALVGGAGELSPDALIGMAENGVAAFKTFMIARFKELAASDGQMLDNFKTIAGTGLPCLIHAENEDIVSRWREKALATGRTDPIAHSEFRPPIAEDEATMRTIMLAGETDVHLHVCHMTTKGAASILGWAKAKGMRVTGETSPNYLLLTADAMRKVGPFAKIDPPLRGKEDQTALWRALNNGAIDALASDHAPYPKADKERGWENIFEAPSGGVGVETSLPLMLDCVNRGLTGIERLVEVFSTNPAKILGLYPRKGAIMLGSDADLVVVDPKRTYEIKGEMLHSKEKVTAFEGYKGQGLPLTTIVRGEIIMENGDLLAQPGYGEFQRPMPRKLRK
ncbi:MAG: dihydroorotase family protein [Candidatus Bathyarchaeota archaeon]|nr:dihydroorotase family protein [Candidatus Bathyarchaeota archaeon]